MPWRPEDINTKLVLLLDKCLCLFGAWSRYMDKCVAKPQSDQLCGFVLWGAFGVWLSNMVCISLPF